METPTIISPLPLHVSKPIEKIFHLPLVKSTYGKKSPTTKKRWRIILTVPHATCPTIPAKDESLHPCDSSALHMAELIDQALQNLNIDTYLVKADLPRSTVDMNRIVGRHSALTNFRAMIRSEIMANYPRAIILDIHSYPPAKDDWAKYNMVILDSDNKIMSLGRIINRAITDMNSGISCYHVAVDRVNDIMDEAVYEYDMYAALLEFNETLTTEKRYEMANILASVVKKFLFD